MRKAEGGFEVVPPVTAPAPFEIPGEDPPPRPSHRRRRHRIFPYAVNRGRLQRAIQNSRAAASIVDDLEQADVILTLKSQEKRQPKRLQEARARGVPFYSIRHNTATQMETFLAEIVRRSDGHDRDPGDNRSYQAEAARTEAEAAAHEVMASGRPVELAPRNAYLRRVQHELAGLYELNSESKDVEPFRRVIIYPRV